jgi:hypothetical protein
VVELKGLGYVTVTTAGTPVPLSSTQIITPGCLIQAAKTNTGIVYIGGSDLGALTRATELSPGEAIEIVGPGISGSEEELNLAQIKIDAATSGDKVVVSYFIRS